jgi:hypothetical protein
MTDHQVLQGFSDTSQVSLHKNNKAYIRSVMTYACPAWEFVADTYLLKLQHVQNKVLCTIDNFPGAHWSMIYMWLSKFHMFMIS